MNIIGFNYGHDGHVVGVKDFKLSYSIEAEKDSGSRYSSVDSKTLSYLLSKTEEFPDVLAVSGWAKGGDPRGFPFDGGYVGLSTNASQKISIFGRTIIKYSVSHERSHILSSYALSPYSQGEPCYCLLWEGHIGSFYYIDEDMIITKLGSPLFDTGIRYAFLFALADPTFTFGRGMIRMGDAGKLMALSAFGKTTEDELLYRDILNYILSPESASDSLCKEDLKDNIFYNIGVEDLRFTNLARILTNKIFDIFYDFAKRKISKKIPLLISGGCGLNCEWNTKWLNSGLFSNIFIPPCVNDSGVSIGAVAEAQFAETGTAKLEWSVFSGVEFIEDTNDYDEYICSPLDLAVVYMALKNKSIIAWVQGKYEIGPRSLGHRSILADPSFPGMLSRINSLKGREKYRPIAPICRDVDMEKYFSEPHESPYMLHFQKVLVDSLPAITHVDRTARCQSITRTDNSLLWNLLQLMDEGSGQGVLCNTSLNFNGKGFINSMSELVRFSSSKDIDGFIVNEMMYFKGENV